MLKYDACQESVLTLPITSCIHALKNNKKITAMVVIALGILIACAVHVHTAPMNTFRDFLSHTYKKVADFLRNPIHLGLVTGIMFIVYGLIGCRLLYSSLLEKIKSEENNMLVIFYIEGMRTGTEDKDVYNKSIYAVQTSELYYYLPNGLDGTVQGKEHKMSEHLLRPKTIKAQTIKQKVCGMAKQGYKTIVKPVTYSLGAMYKHYVITSIAVMIIAILIVCVTYINTPFMNTFRERISIACQKTTQFLSNPNYAGLVYGLIGTIYLLIGSGLINHSLKNIIKRIATSYDKGVLVKLTPVNYGKNGWQVYENSAVSGEYYATVPQDDQNCYNNGRGRGWMFKEGVPVEITRYASHY